MPPFHKYEIRFGLIILQLSRWSEVRTKPPNLVSQVGDTREPNIFVSFHVLESLILSLNLAHENNLNYTYKI